MAKIFTWQGRTEEEIKELDLSTFMELIPARSRRSLKRGFTEQQKKLLKRLETGEDNVKTHCRNLVIMPLMVGKTLRIHNGKSFETITITAEMLGHVLGEFSLTRKLIKHSSAGVGATRSSKAISAR
jgi:small subunit ribosomal protein S19